MFTTLLNKQIRRLSALRLTYARCRRINLIICLNLFIKRNFQLVAHIFIILVIQHIQTVTEIPGIFIGKRAKQPVPERKDIAEVFVCIGPHIMMMHLVHIWGNKQQADGPVQPQWYTDICMIEMCENGGNTAI